MGKEVEQNILDEIPALEYAEFSHYRNKRQRCGESGVIHRLNT